MEQKVIYNGQLLVLTQFWATGEPCLWITDPQQIEMPKMEFVGGYPNEYCIFLKNLTETELALELCSENLATINEELVHQILLYFDICLLGILFVRLLLSEILFQ